MSRRLRTRLQTISGAAGTGGGVEPGAPTLVMDFTPAAGSSGSESLILNFTSQIYNAFTRDTSQPQAGLANIQVWN